MVSKSVSVTTVLFFLALLLLATPDVAAVVAEDVSSDVAADVVEDVAVDVDEEVESDFNVDVAVAVGKTEFRSLWATTPF